MGTMMLRRSVLGLFALLGLAALGGDLLAQGKHGGGGGAPPPTPDIAFVELTGKDVLLRVMSADGSNARTVIGARRSTSMIDTAPCWSPDGNRLAFVGVWNGGSGLWSVAVSGGSPSLLVPFAYTIPPYYPNVDWSRTQTPDGSDKIVFTAPIGGANDAFVVNPDGSGLQNLTQSGDVLRVCWRQDATALVVVDTNYAVTLNHLAPAAGGLTIAGVTPLGTMGGLPHVACANAHDWISLKTGPGGVQIVDLSTSPPGLTDLGNIRPNQAATFSPDDSRLVYRRNQSLYTCFVDGTGETLIRDGDHGYPWCFSVAWRRN